MNAGGFKGEAWETYINCEKSFLEKHTVCYITEVENPCVNVRNLPNGNQSIKQISFYICSSKNRFYAHAIG